MKNAQYIIAMLCTSPSANCMIVQERAINLDDNVQSGIAEKFQQFGDSIKKLFSKINIDIKQSVDNNTQQLVDKARSYAQNIEINDLGMFLLNDNASNCAFFEFINNICTIPEEILHKGDLPIREYCLASASKVLSYIDENMLLGNNDDVVQKNERIIIAKKNYICYAVSIDWVQRNQLFEMFVKKVHYDSSTLEYNKWIIRCWADTCRLCDSIDHDLAVSIWDDYVVNTGLYNGDYDNVI